MNGARIRPGVPDQIIQAGDWPERRSPCVASVSYRASPLHSRFLNSNRGEWR